MVVPNGAIFQERRVAHKVNVLRPMAGMEAGASLWEHLLQREPVWFQPMTAMAVVDSKRKSYCQVGLKFPQVIQTPASLPIKLVQINANDW